MEDYSILGAWLIGVIIMTFLTQPLQFAFMLIIVGGVIIFVFIVGYILLWVNDNIFSDN